MVTKADWFAIALTFLAIAAGFLLGGTVAGVTCLFLGLAVLVVWWRASDHGLSDPGDHAALGSVGEIEEAKTSTKAALREWGKLEKRFAKLQADSIAASHRRHDALTIST